MNAWTAAAAALYVLAAATILRDRLRVPATAAALLALVAHAVALGGAIVHADRLLVGVTEAMSLFAWQAAALLWVLCLLQDLRVLALAVFPAAALAALAAAIWPSSLAAMPLPEWKVQLHIALSLFAAGFLSLAAVQALALAIQDRHLHHRPGPPVSPALPPLQTMESLLFQLIVAGFFTLSLSLATGLLFVDDLLAQHLAHKTVLTSLAWLIFGTLLWGRWRRGWRGRTALRWTLSGYGFLILGYFGSKFVLEQLLGKQWT